MDLETYYYYDRVKELALALPAVYEKQAYGTPSFYVEKKLFTRFWENGTTLVLYNNERDEWIATNPNTFFITDHYLNYPMLLVNLEKVKQADLKALLKTSWELRASKKLLKQQ